MLSFGGFFDGSCGGTGAVLPASVSNPSYLPKANNSLLNSTMSDPAPASEKKSGRGRPKGSKATGPKDWTKPAPTSTHTMGTRGK